MIGAGGARRGHSARRGWQLVRERCVARTRRQPETRGDEGESEGGRSEQEPPLLVALEPARVAPRRLSQGRQLRRRLNLARVLHGDFRRELAVIGEWRERLTEL